MNLFQLSLPNFLGYASVAWVLLKALAHVYAVRDVVRGTHEAEERYEADVGSALVPSGAGTSRPGVTLALLRAHVGRSTASHPTVTLLRHVLASPRLAQDQLALDAWMSHAVEAHIGRLRTSIDQNAGLAPSLGLLGTIVGFLIGTYMFSVSRDSSQLMASVAMALGTTLVAAIVVMIERHHLRGVLLPLEIRCVLHAQANAARARALLECWEPEEAGCGACRGAACEAATPSAAPAPAACAEEVVL